MKANECTLTERGQVSIPADLRKGMHLKPGQKLRWEAVSERECRVIVENETPPGPMAALGYGPKLRREKGRTTREWMNELRAGE